ncbi:MAG TPA: PhzF family phenazine biosynthesis protein [Thermococcaceae archaeon]|uniref:Phenazine biosynthesis protein PhzF family n=1 Tax=Thermococcus sibiricus (strain DSM 12597 / MM 739) TaxID=604354 RepID=C6A313_THESM|nr:PhzF family phenazine biosynthesis protein [Thermococcus sibiricus]ACS90008.1 Phenazine biosynthesis protein PhzF family [Thermococcus sibiricus MM 739]HII66695.1 PhzF family phenazine biosynthesis protein [Thermococcaceae archaeon]
MDVVKCRVFKLDAFTNQAFKGNPAAVVLDCPELDAEIMLAIAGELNLSETAFVWPEKKGFRVRFFTPGDEIPLCGHATVATFYLLWRLGMAKEGMNKMISKVGELDILIKDKKVWLKQLPPKIIGELNIEELKSILGVKELVGPALAMTTGTPEGIVGIRTFNELMNIKPNMETLAEFSKENGIIGVYVYTLDSKFDAAGRFFAPAVGVPEDPVTGTASGILAGYLRLTDKLTKDSYIFEQGHALKREGKAYVKFEGNYPWVGGEARIILEGQLEF